MLIIDQSFIFLLSQIFSVYVRHSLSDAMCFSFAFINNALVFQWRTMSGFVLL